MKPYLLAATFGLAAALTTAPAFAEAQAYKLDPSHSQILFTYDHLGFSTGMGMFSGFEGEIMFDKEDPAASSVTVSMPATSMLTGWEARLQHFMSPAFFDTAAKDDAANMITFTSTGIDVTGDDTAEITGDLTLNGVTKSVVLDAKLNKVGEHPMEGVDWAGFDATTTLLRSDFDLGQFAPFISDEVEVTISVEAMDADQAS